MHKIKGSKDHCNVKTKIVQLNKISEKKGCLVIQNSV